MRVSQFKVNIQRYSAFLILIQANSRPNMMQGPTEARCLEWEARQNRHVAAHKSLEEPHTSYKLGVVYFVLACHSLFIN